MRLADAVVAMNGITIAGSTQGELSGIALDSRRVAGGELFFALMGEQTDGHRFVAAAAQRGACAAVVAHLPEPAPAPDFCLVQVPDVTRALHDLTVWVRRRLPRHLVAVTGSAGKTTTKELLARLLASRYRACASPGNFNNLYGFPIALLSIPDDTEWMVAEMGMSTPGELGGVSRLGRPEVAVFTNVRAVHLEAFEAAGMPATLRTVGDAKAELLEGLSADGLVVANAADPEVVRIAERHRRRGGRVVWFSLAPQPNERASRLTVAELEAAELEVANPGAGPARVYGSRFLLVDTITGVRQPVALPLHGTVNVENFLAAATAAVELGVSLPEIATAATGAVTAPGRGRVVPVAPRALLVDDSYNSNPDALRRALVAAAGLPGARHWAVIGQMLELGRGAEAAHRELGRAAAELGFDPVIGVGELARHLVEEAAAAGVEARWLSDAQGAAAAAAGELRAGDVVLVKGSRGVGLERVVTALTQGGGNA